MLDEVEALDLALHGEPDCAGKRVPSERRCVIAGLEYGAVLAGKGCPNREAACQSLCQRHDIWLNAPLRMRPQCAAATDAGLHLIEHEQQVTLVAELAHVGEVARFCRMEPSLGLDR